MIATSNAWFDPNVYAWIPGTALGLLGALEGATAGTLAPKGKCKAVIFGMHFSGIFVCAGLFLAGLIAKATGQPYGVWYGLGLPGLLGLILFGSLTPVLIRRYREAEMRKSVAQDL